MHIAPPQETFGIQNPAATEATLMQESLRSQGILLEGNIFSPTNDGDLLGVGHLPLSHTQSMGSEMPQNYLAVQGKYTLLTVAAIETQYSPGFLLSCPRYYSFKVKTHQISSMIPVPNQLFATQSDK